MDTRNDILTEIYIKDMRLHAYHGVLEQENTVGNDYIINLRVAYPFLKACESDDVNDTMSYAEAAEIIRKQMRVPSKLLENVAYRIIQSLSASFPLIEKISIDVRKIAPPMPFDTDGAGVTIHWNKQV